MAKQTRDMAAFDPDRTPRPAFVLGLDFPGGEHPGSWHAHSRAQLMYASQGVLTVRSEHGLWVIPPERAVWLLPGVRHAAGSSRPHRFCSLYVEASLASLPPHCAVVAVEPLVRELLLAASEFGAGYEEGSAEERLIRVILDRLPVLPLVALHLPEPKDEDLRRITSGLARTPADNSPLREWAELVGLTERTAARRFQSELGMTFGRWRQQLRLLKALEELAYGESVTEVAFDVGYGDVSSFIAMFRKALGKTPAQYFRSQDDPRE